jgi:hypothetical protein
MRKLFEQPHYEARVLRFASDTALEKWLTENAEPGAEFWSASHVVPTLIPNHWAVIAWKRKEPQ